MPARKLCACAEPVEGEDARMNALNHGLTAVFDLLLGPLEWLGKGTALVLVSGIFGVLALIAFKHLSAQRGIKNAKDKIKAHLIAISIYQDDLAIVGKSLGRVLLRNFQYLGLNLLPFVPLSIPFVFVLAQLVTRYAFAPVPVTASAEHVMPGRGTTIEVELARYAAADVGKLQIKYPDGVVPVSPLVRNAADGRAFQEVVATRSGEFAIQFKIEGVTESKLLYAGDVDPRAMQPERGRGFIASILWPAEDSFGSASPFERVSFAYPDSAHGFLMGGTGGVLLTFLVSSMVFGALAIKPLKIQI